MADPIDPDDILQMNPGLEDVVGSDGMRSLAETFDALGKLTRWMSRSGCC